LIMIVVIVKCCLITPMILLQYVVFIKSAI
jgi:hypothetical protein